jgi:hypothetical protein
MGVVCGCQSETNSTKGLGVDDDDDDDALDGIRGVDEWKEDDEVAG